jgi:two-component system sensor histidine kinase YesM
MFNLGRLKLRQLLALMIGFSIVMMILVQIFYYFRFRSLTQERAENYAVNLMNQIDEQLSIIARDLEKGASTIAYNRHVQEYLVIGDPKRKLLELAPFMFDVLEYVKSSNENIYDILIWDGEGKLITSVDNYQNGIYDELIKKYQFTEAQFKTPTHTAVIKVNDDIFYYYAYILPIFSINKKVELFTKIGTCVVICKTTPLEKRVLDISIVKDSLFMVLDSENKILVANRSADQGKAFTSIAFSDQNKEGKLKLKYNGKNSIVQYRTINRTGWKIVSIIPIADLMSDMRPIRSFGLFIGIITALMLLLFDSIFSYSITHNISDLVNFMRNIGEQNIKQRLELAVQNEFGFIAENINRMLDKIEDMTRSIFTAQSKLYEAELAKKQTELAALQSQINPHFLYNTLNCISTIGLAHELPDIVNISSAMSRIFRYCIKEADIVLIKDEMACIKDYLSIMSIRYKGKFSIEIKVDEILLEMKTIKMILQPIVENAVYHGIERKKGPGKLVIKGCLVHNERINFMISDDGKGMTKEELEELLGEINTGAEGEKIKRQEKRSIGLANIHHRIRLLFGDQYGISIASIENKGTEVHIELPVIE